MCTTLTKGDILYYPPHNALGLLLARERATDGEYHWRYSLRSPARDDRSRYLTTIMTVVESRALESIKRGDLKHYRKKKSH